MSLKNWEGKVWDGVFASFAEVPYENDVFEETIWQNKVFNRAQDLLSNLKSTASIPKAATTHEYALPFVLCMAEATEKGLSVLDFGGGLGTSYIPLKAMLPSNKIKEFVVIENKAICAMGEKLFLDDERIKFIDKIPTNVCFDVVHAGSSLHYVEDWETLLHEFAETRANYLIFADLPAGDNKTFVTAQLFHDRRIPVRFWNLKEFINAVEILGYEIIFKSNYRGYYMAQDSKLPTDHFESSYQLKDFCQLIFKSKKNLRNQNV